MSALQRLVGALIAAMASFATAAPTLTANFDSFAEGVVGTVFADGGIVFSDLDSRAGIPPPGVFTIDAAAPDAFGPPFSPPNVLTPGGWVSGPGFVTGVRFGSMSITFGDVPATAASIDVFGFAIGLNTLTLEALRDGTPVAHDSVHLVVPNARWQDTLSVSGALFDELRLVASGTEDLGVVFVVFDNASVTLVPEPATAALLGVGLLGLVGYRRRTNRGC